jgi:hypothetical protein
MLKVAVGGMQRPAAPPLLAQAGGRENLSKPKQNSWDLQCQLDGAIGWGGQDKILQGQPGVARSPSLVEINPAHQHDYGAPTVSGAYTPTTVAQTLAMSHGDGDKSESEK